MTVPGGTPGPVPVRPLAVQPRLSDAVGPDHLAARAGGRGGAAFPVRRGAPPGQSGRHGGHHRVGLVLVLHDGEALLGSRSPEQKLRGVYHERRVATCGQIEGEPHKNDIYSLKFDYLGRFRHCTC